MFQCFAQTLHVKHQYSYGEHWIELPKHAGKGQIRGINFPNGVGWFHYEIKPKKKCQIILDYKEQYPLKFIYLLSGRLYHQFTQSSTRSMIETGESLITSSAAKEKIILTLEKGKSHSFRYLDIDRKMFEQQLTFPLAEMSPIYFRLFADTQGIYNAYHKSYYSLQITECIDQLDHFKQEGLARTSYLGAKSLEILSYMILMYKDDMRNAENSKVIRYNEREDVLKAIRYVDKSFDRIRSVEDILNVVAINASKLQKGFRLITGLSVKQYLRKRRMEHALYLLTHTNLAIRNIVFEIGLSSQSHFTKIFKKQYGKLPSEVRTSN